MQSSGYERTKWYFPWALSHGTCILHIILLTSGFYLLERFAIFHGNVLIFPNRSFFAWKKNATGKPNRCNENGFESNWLKTANRLQMQLQLRLRLSLKSIQNQSLFLMHSIDKLNSRYPHSTSDYVFFVWMTLFQVIAFIGNGSGGGGGGFGLTCLLWRFTEKSC